MTIAVDLGRKATKQTKHLYYLQVKQMVRNCYSGVMSLKPQAGHMLSKKHSRLLLIQVGLLSVLDESRDVLVNLLREACTRSV